MPTVNRFTDTYVLTYKVKSDKGYRFSLLEDCFEENLIGRWDYEYCGKGETEFYFEIEEDAVAFKLRWS